MKEDQSIESSIQSLRNSKNWNDLPVELKLECIGKMTEKTKVILSMCSKFDQKIVKSEGKKLNLVSFKEEKLRSINKWGENDWYYKLTLWTINNSGELVLQYDMRCLWLDRSGFERDRYKCFKLLYHFLNNFEINTVKLEYHRDTIGAEFYTEFEKEPRKVKNLEVKCDCFYKELFEYAMKFNPNTIRLCCTGGRWFPLGLKYIVECMVDLNFEIGRKVELSAIESSVPSHYFGPSYFLVPTPVFGPSGLAEILAPQVNATVVANNESYFRLALKEDPNKHIVVLNCSLIKFQSAVVSKDFNEIPDTFF